VLLLLLFIDAVCDQNTARADLWTGADSEFQEMPEPVSFYGIPSYMRISIFNQIDTVAAGGN
jgi:hypothetical protein